MSGRLPGEPRGSVARAAAAFKRSVAVWLDARTPCSMSSTSGVDSGVGPSVLRRTIWHRAVGQQLDALTGDVERHGAPGA